MAFDRKCVVGKPEFQVLFPLRLLELPGPQIKCGTQHSEVFVEGQNIATARIEVLIVEKVGR